MSRSPVLFRLFLFGVFAAWGSPCVAGPIMGTMSLSPVTVNGDLRTFEVHLDLVTDTDWKLGYFSLDISDSTAILNSGLNGGGACSRFSFTISDTLIGWYKEPDPSLPPGPSVPLAAGAIVPFLPTKGRLQLESTDEPLELTTGSYTLGYLTLDLSGLTVDANTRVAINAPSPDDQHGTRVGGDFFGDPFDVFFGPADFPDPNAPRPDGFAASQLVNPQNGGPSPVPAPPSLLAAATGGLILMAYRRWRKPSAAAA